MPHLLRSPPLPAPSSPLLFFTQPRCPTRTPIGLSPRTLVTRSLSLRPPAARPLPEWELLNAISSLPDGEYGARTHLPAVRSYESDLASLTLIGSVASDQALTAAAADGGAAAEEHLSSAIPNMVIETLFPSSPDEHSTVSTRLFLPAKKVKEKAKKLRRSLTADILSSNVGVSKNILAMTFRQVVMQQLGTFKLSLFSSGTQRNMGDLMSPRKAPTDFTVSSSDQSFLSALAEVVCSLALESTSRSKLKNAGVSHLGSIFTWFQKPQGIFSADSSISIHRFSHGEIVKIAKSHNEKLNQGKGRMTSKEGRIKRCWWMPQDYLGVEKAGDPVSDSWMNEFIPAYRLHVDGHRFEDINFEGWKKLDDSRWEVLLTHFQMVELANILDIYYEDEYTLPDKQLSCILVTKTSNISANKRSSWNVLLVALTSGCFLIFGLALAQLWSPHLLRARKIPQLTGFISSSESDSCLVEHPEATVFEGLCTSIVKKIKDELGWSGSIMVDTNIGSWTGTLPSYLRNKNIIFDNGESSTNYDGGEVQVHADSLVDATSLGTINKGNQTIAHNIASYQVVLSGDGRIVGFQPTSRLAVNQWASNPLTKALYGARRLSPGLFEPSLKIPKPREVVLIELLMSVNPTSRFALARPAQLSQEDY